MTYPISYQIYFPQDQKISSAANTSTNQNSRCMATLDETIIHGYSQSHFYLLPPHYDTQKLYETFIKIQNTLQYHISSRQLQWMQDPHKEQKVLRKKHENQNQEAYLIKTLVIQSSNMNFNCK